MYRMLTTLILAWCLILSLSNIVGARPVQSQSSLFPLTNRDILAMVKAKVPVEQIIAKIKTSRCHFDMTPTVLDELRHKRVPEAILVAMYEAPYGQPKPARAEVPNPDGTRKAEGQPRINSSQNVNTTNRPELAGSLPQKAGVPSAGFPQRIEVSSTERTVNAQPVPERIQWGANGCRRLTHQVEAIPPTEMICDQMYVEGQSVRSIERKGLYVSLVAGIYQDYFVADVFVMNLSDKRFDVVSKNVTSVLWKKDNAPPETYTGISPTTIAQKINKKASFKSFLVALAGATAKRQTDVSSVSTGSVMVVGPNGTASGTYSGTTMATITEPDDEARRRAADRIAKIRSDAAAKGDAFANLGLRDTTLFPNQSVGGAVFFPKKHFKVGLISIKLDGVVYEFFVGPPEK
jgi:hypothetical protein